jgi:hypothetical protein
MRRGDKREGKDRHREVTNNNKKREEARNIFPSPFPVLAEIQECSIL